MAVNARENLLSLWRRQGYEEHPPQFHLCPTLVATYERETGQQQPYGEYFRFPQRQIGGIHPRRPEVDWRRYYVRNLHPDTSFNLYGVAHEPGSAAAYHMRRKHHPLQRVDSIAALEDYPWPEWSDLEVTTARAEAAATRAAGRLPEHHMAQTIWETAWAIRGMNELMMDMATDDPKAVFLLDRITDHACARIRAYAAAGVDHIHVGDDVGMQRGLMMSEGMYREWLKPRLARVIAAGRAVKPDLFISYHSCGHVTPLVGDFIEVGVDMLNPIQSECMDFAALHAEYGAVLSFWGTIGTQTVMPKGAPADVREAVFRHLDIAGACGGLWAAPTHVLEPEVPWANVIAYIEACRDYPRQGA